MLDPQREILALVDNFVADLNQLARRIAIEQVQTAFATAGTKLPSLSAPPAAPSRGRGPSGKRAAASPSPAASPSGGGRGRRRSRDAAIHDREPVSKREREPVSKRERDPATKRDPAGKRAAAGKREAAGKRATPTNQRELPFPAREPAASPRVPREAAPPAREPADEPRGAASAPAPSSPRSQDAPPSGAALRGELIATIGERPGLRTEELNAVLGTTTLQIARLLRQLIAEQQVRTEGARRGTRYFPSAVDAAAIRRPAEAGAMTEDSLA
jgi:hypothetical protein